MFEVVCPCVAAGTCERHHCAKGTRVSSSCEAGSCERSAVNNEARAKAYKTPVECAGKRGAMSAVALKSLAWIGEERHNNGGLHSLHSTGLI